MGCFHDWDMYWPYLKFRLLQASTEELKEIYEVEEGIRKSSAYSSHKM